nr:hypothetical protein [Tanacetum cinerariifolium]
MRTPTQVVSHAQKRRSSLFDMTTDSVGAISIKWIPNGYLSSHSCSIFIASASRESNGNYNIYHLIDPVYPITILYMFMVRKKKMKSGCLILGLANLCCSLWVDGLVPPMCFMKVLKEIWFVANNEVKETKKEDKPVVANTKDAKHVTVVESGCSDQRLGKLRLLSVPEGESGESETMDLKVFKFTGA